MRASLEFVNFDRFGFVSDFGLRISDLTPSRHKSGTKAYTICLQPLLLTRSLGPRGLTMLARLVFIVSLAKLLLDLLGDDIDGRI